MDAVNIVNFLTLQHGGFYSPLSSPSYDHRGRLRVNELRSMPYATTVLTEPQTPTTYRYSVNMIE